MNRKDTTKANPERLKELDALLYQSRKIYHYRKDILAEEDNTQLRTCLENLETALDEGLGNSKLASDSLRTTRKLLDRIGSHYYHKPSIFEWVELFLVVAAITLAFRHYFFQNFKIPTNSMYPTYNGLTFKSYDATEDSPGPVSKVGHRLLYGSRHYAITAPVDGELLVPVETPSMQNGGSKYVFRLKGKKKEYVLLIGGYEVYVKVPREFNFDKVMDDYLDNFEWEVVGSTRGPVLKTNAFFDEGERVLAFDILTGDNLLVDRVTYNFRKPKIGESIVFPTQNVPGLTERNAGIPQEKYYIKRLVGKGGDTLKVDYPVLYRNGEPVSGAEAFEYNQNQEGEYEGYTNRNRLAEGKVEHIPDGFYYAMGDNSDESSDSRYWGFVPQKEVIGKAFFIYYPFSKRWGVAK